MEIPKYIVYRVDVMRKGTSVELTNITDDVEDVILKAEQTEPQCEKCKHFREEAEMYTHQCEFYFMECKFEPKAEPQFDKDINVRSKDEPNSSEKPNNCEPKICDTCRYYNSNIPCGSTPSACKEADKFAEEFVQGLKNLQMVAKNEPQTETSTNSEKVQLTDEPQTERSE